jgi:hypothetical protein
MEDAAHKQEIAVTSNEDAAPEGTLPAKQEAALLAVISNPTLKEAALAAGVSETTLWRYMQDEAFKRRLREARREAVGHAVTRLQRASADAVTVLQELMMKEGAPAAARITAARTVLDYAVRADEAQELKARIEELEEFVKIRREEEALDASKPEEEAA